MGRRKNWSYNAGEKGRNWVRAYEDSRSGALYLEYRRPVLDPETGEPETDAKGRVVMKRKAVRLKVTSRERAKQKAKDLAERFEQMGSTAERAFSVRDLLHLYQKEVTPTKGISKQGHDRRARRVFLAFFDSQEEPERRSHRPPSTLDRIDWERFCTAREAGTIPGWGQVAQRQTGFDVKYLIAVLNWATGVERDGAPLLAVNPWGRDWRRAQRLRIPKNPTPHQPTMTEEIREALIRHAPGWQFAAALRLERETMSRNNAVRQLYWDEVNLVEEWVEWRGEKDKSGLTVRTPLTARAVEVLRGLPSRAIGHVPVFPSASEATEPTPRDTFQTWLRRAKDRLVKSLPEEQREDMRARLKGLGFHGEKRAAVRDPEFRKLPIPIQEKLARTTYQTLRTVYDRVEMEDMREALKGMRVGT